MAKEKYRFENGHLYVLDGNAYIHCFHNARIRTKAAAIKAYEEEIALDPDENDDYSCHEDQMYQPSWFD
jgi:hypothetical protein